MRRAGIDAAGAAAGAGGVPPALSLGRGPRLRGRAAARRDGARPPSSGRAPRRVRGDVQARHRPRPGRRREATRRRVEEADLVSGRRAQDPRRGWSAPGTWASTTSWPWPRSGAWSWSGSWTPTSPRRSEVAAPYGSARLLAITASWPGQIDFATVAVPTEQHFDGGARPARSGRPRARREAHDRHPRGGQGALPDRPRAAPRAPRGPRRALQRGGAGAPEDRGAARSSSSRAGSAPSCRACRATRW